ncbi:cutinase family protein [Streptomyces populi]
MDRTNGRVVVGPPDPVPAGRLDRFAWRISRTRVEALTTGSRGRVTFLFDSVENEVDVWDLFDIVVCVLGGYSQGGSVTDIALGIRTRLGTGRAIPAGLAGRVKAVAVFGNPLRLSGRTIASAGDVFGSRAAEFCNTGDPVCGNGRDGAAHLTYHLNGSVEQGARFAAEGIGRG